MADIKQNYDTPIEQFGIQPPGWIDDGLTVGDLARMQPRARAVVEEGCASAEIHRIAMEIMSEHGDDVLAYIADVLGELPQPKCGLSWSGMAVFYATVAVELWAADALDDIESGRARKR